MDNAKQARYFVALGVKSLRVVEIHTFRTLDAAAHFYDSAQACGAQVAGRRCDKMGFGRHVDPVECIRRAWGFTATAATRCPRQKRYS